MSPAAASSAWRRPLRSAALRIAVGALMLMAVTVAIGRPTVFTDTDDYYAEGRGIVRALDLWVKRGRPPIDPAQVHDHLTDPDSADQEPVHNEEGARSPYYGLFLYLTQAAGTLWLTALIQALGASALLHALWRAAAPGARDRSWYALMAGLALGSTLPVFTGFAMPDVFAGLAAVSTVLILLYADRFGRLGRAALWLALAACLNFHGSNLLTCAPVSAAALVLLAWRRTGWRPMLGRAALVLAAAVAAIGAGKAYALALKLRTGDDLGRPPFLSARVLADGPGRVYLRHACAAGARYTLCAYRRLPLTDSEDILWSDEPTLGIFNLADFPTRVRLEQEDKRFMLAAVLSDPLGQARASLKNAAVQLVDVKLDEPLKDPGYYLLDSYWRTTHLPGLIRRARPCDPRGGGCRTGLPNLAMAWTDGLIALAALAWLGLRLAREGWSRLGRRGDGLGLVYASALVLVLAVVANAFVCGVISGPFPRYQARILWLVPAAAALVEIARRRLRGATGA